MKEIQLTRGKIALVDDHWFEYLNQWKWGALKGKGTWYAITWNRNALGPGRDICIYMHRVVSGAKEGEFVDHRDRDGLNNQEHNLRKCSLAQNNRNRDRNKNGTSGYKGVTIRKQNKKVKYIAQITVDRKAMYLGIFLTAEQAASAYDDAAKKYYGSFAYLNFPDPAP